MRPACMDDEAWGRWSELNGRLIPSGRADTPCRDCFEAYHVEMRSVGRCDGIPQHDGAPRQPTAEERVEQRRAYAREWKRMARARARVAA